MHYLVIHWDIPAADETTWTVDVDGLVDRPLTLSLADLRARPAVTRPVTMECAGNGRALMPPRAESQPWLDGAVGNAEWTGTPLPPILEEAGVQPGAVDLVFTGADHGIQGDVEQDYQWGFSLADIVRDDVLLAYEMNGQPLPPQHGFPVRLLVPDWYGMCSVKWLRRITAIAEPFDGFQLSAYQLRQEPDGPGVPVTRKAVRALMLPPGFTDFPARQRFVDAGPMRAHGPSVVRAGAHRRASRSASTGERPGRTPTSARHPASSSSWRAWSFDVGCRSRANTSSLVPCHRRGRQRPAGRPALELRRVHEQHAPARARRRFAEPTGPRSEHLRGAPRSSGRCPPPC